MDTPVLSAGLGGVVVMTVNVVFMFGLGSIVVQG